MNEGTFLRVPNNNPAPQGMTPDMGMQPGDAFSMPQDSPMNGGDHGMMGNGPMDGGMDTMDGGMGPIGGADPNMMGNEPSMGADPFDGQSDDASMSKDPVQKAESLAGQLAALGRNQIGNDIDKQTDTKKEILGMVISGFTSNSDEEERNELIDYISDKMNGAGESDGNDQSNDNDTQDNQQDDMDQMNDGMQGGDNMGGGMPMQEKIDRLVKEMLMDLTKKKDSKKKSKVDQENKKGGYISRPFKSPKF